MASLVRRKDGRLEIRETLTTPRGPRSRTLASFSRELTPDVLSKAAARAQRPFDAEALLHRARELGIHVAERPRGGEAHRFLAVLRQGTPIDPRLVMLLQQALVERRSAPLPPELQDAAEWVGRGERARGQALRGLLRTYDRILSSRGPLRERRGRRFPVIRSRGA